MKKVFIKRGLKRMLSISLIVTMVLALPSVSVKKAKAEGVTCPVCGAIGYGNHPSTNATCTEPAYEILYYSCNVHTVWKRDLSELYGSSYGPKGHDCYYESAANCVHGATYRCSRCNYVYYSGPLDYSKHTWVKTADATCTSAASYRCSTCGDEVFRGSALAHDYYVSASATTERGTEHTCRVCGNKYYDNDKITIFTLSFDASTNGGTWGNNKSGISNMLNEIDKEPLLEEVLNDGKVIISKAYCDAETEYFMRYQIISYDEMLYFIEHREKECITFKKIIRKKDGGDCNE